VAGFDQPNLEPMLLFGKYFRRKYWIRDGWIWHKIQQIFTEKNNHNNILQKNCQYFYENYIFSCCQYYYLYDDIWPAYILHFRKKGTLW
jgi:hypothetical protein